MWLRSSIERNELKNILEDTNRANIFGSVQEYVCENVCLCEIGRERVRMNERGERKRERM